MKILNWRIIDQLDPKAPMTLFSISSEQAESSILARYHELIRAV